MAVSGFKQFVIHNSTSIRQSHKYYGLQRIRLSLTSKYKTHTKERLCNYRQALPRNKAEQEKTRRAYRIFSSFQTAKAKTFH